MEKYLYGTKCAQSEMSCIHIDVSTGPQSDDPATFQGQADSMDLVVSEKVIKPVENQLPFRTLVLRRGLAVALMLFILAAGIIMNLLITNLVT